MAKRKNPLAKPGQLAKIGGTLASLRVLQRLAMHFLSNDTYVMSKEFSLAVEARTLTGKNVKRLRAAGTTPAVVYGHGVQPTAISFGSAEFSRMFREAGTSSLIYLQLGKQRVPTLVHDVQRDPVRGDITHVDFHAVSLTEKTTAQVHLEFTGEAPAVKTFGAIVNIITHEVEVEALPQDLPESIVVDLTKLEAADSAIHAGELALPKGVALMDIDADAVIVSVSVPVAEAEETEAAVIPEGGVEAVAQKEEGKAE